MKRSLLIIVSLLAILAMLFTTAATIPPSVKFVLARFTPGKGVVFVFEVNGLQDKDLKGYVNFSGKRFNLDCAPGDANKVNCVAGDGISQFAGKSVSGVLAGFGFTAKVPARRVSCDSWSFKSDAGWYYIFSNVNDGTDAIWTHYHESVLPDTVECYGGPWSPNVDFWYETYVGS
jgi:hypothetical protein